MSWKLTPAGRTALWIGGGAFVGLAVGGLITNPDRALGLSPFWTILFALYVGVVIAVARQRVDAAPSAAAGPSPAARRPAPAQDGALAVRFELPDVPPRFPLVMGAGEPLHVRVRVEHHGRPSEGAGVRLRATMEGEALDGDGVTGSEGGVEFTLEPESPGELRLMAEAKAGAYLGHGETAVSIVNYDEEIQRLFGEFRAFAVGVLGPEAHADTARELAEKLRARAGPEAARALLELARVYELVAYGERKADRRLYVAVMEQLLLLDQAELPDATPAALREA